MYGFAGRISVCRAWLAIILFLLPQAVCAIQVPRGLDTCKSLPACLELLNQVVPKQDTGEGSNSEIIARDLRRFGEPAKQALLKRAAGNQPGWRNVAGAILADWNDWTVDDVPALREALQMDHGGWIARPLGQIGSPDAIRALVEDLSEADDFQNQTGFALSKLGEKAAPYLIPLLEDDKKSWLAAGVIAEMKPLPIPYASTWARMALDTRRPLKERLAALRGIAAMGSEAQQASIKLHVLLADQSSEIKKEAEKTLIGVRDPIVVEHLAKNCQPRAAHYDPVALDSELCLREIADFGPPGRDAGQFLMPFLDSDNGAERAYAVLTLGYIDYAPAIPKIREALDSKDWRVVYAAIRAAGWLGDQNAISKLDKLASDYWLLEIREYAATVALALRSKARHVDRGTWKEMDHGIQLDPTYVITDGIRSQQKSCPGNLWKWQGESVKLLPDRYEKAHSLNFGNVGKLIGTNHGEWGGELTWIPKQGAPIVLVRDNVHGMEYDDDGAIVLFGLAHLSFNYGYALRVSRNADGTWTQTEIARLPGEPQNCTQLKSNRIAVLTANRVVVFSSKEGILGVASCVSK